MAKHIKSQKSSFSSSDTPSKAAPVKIARHNFDSAQDVLTKTKVASEEASKGAVESYSAGTNGASHLGLHLVAPRSSLGRTSVFT
jgi:hypothetical protein